MDKVKGVISENDFADISKEFNAEKKRLEQIASDSEKQLSELEEKIKIKDNRREIIGQYTDIKHLSREMIEILIDYIAVYKRIPGTSDVPLEIHWNF